MTMRGLKQSAMLVKDATYNGTPLHEHKKTRLSLFIVIRLKMTHGQASLAKNEHFKLCNV